MSAGVGVRGASKRQTAKRLAAYSLWVHHQATVQQTTKAVGITPTTLKRWRDYYSWDEQRRQSESGGAVLLAELHRKRAAFTEALQDTEVSDPEKVEELTKTLNAILDTAERVRRMERDIDYRRLALQWVQSLTDWLKEQDPKALKALQPHLRSFTNYIARESA